MIFLIPRFRDSSLREDEPDARPARYMRMRHVRSMRIRLAVPILALVLAATLAAPPALLQPARAADAGIVYEVLAAIVENHVERP